MAAFGEVSWSPGELLAHRLMHVPDGDNPTSPFLSPHAGYVAMHAPIMAVGVLDENKHPWTTIWGGEAGFARPMGGNFLGIRSEVDAKYDPVAEVLTKTEFGKGSSKGMLISGLAIDLMTRRRAKIMGRVIGGKVEKNETEELEDLQMALNVEQSIGQCPKYINKKDIHPALAKPELLSSGPKLSAEGRAIIQKADLIFISSSNAEIDMDTNNRGGARGFVRLISDNEIAYPELSGNRLYQTLGNLLSTPVMGMVVPDFETGDVLYLTGNVEVLAGEKASALLPRSNLAIKLTIIDSRFVRKGLSFRGTFGEVSPYTPPVRALVSEGNIAATIGETQGIATLISKEDITSTITKYRFKASHPVKYLPGQWVAMDFSDELDIGYSHMRDDDPTSLNDDYIRTFTVSSHPKDLPEDEYEIIARLNGPTTHFLKNHRIMARNPLEIKLRGFGGEFKVEPIQGQDMIPFIAGGVGITPILAHLQELDLSKLRLIWIMSRDDANLAVKVLEEHPQLAKVTTIFFTRYDSALSQTKEIDLVIELGGKIHKTRPSTAKDLTDIAPTAQVWHLCASQGLRKQLLEWLAGRTVNYESFDY